MELYTTGTGQRLRVHSKENCKGDNCVIHNPSDHSMKDWPTNWRPDRYLMERICSHGIGHPDPDDLAFKVRTSELYFEANMHPILKRRTIEEEGVHGCDGCCSL